MRLAMTMQQPNRLGGPWSLILFCYGMFGLCLVEPSPLPFGPWQRACGAESAVRPPVEPEWIWSSTSNGNARSQQFHAAFRIDSAIQTAELRVLADFCHARVEINGLAVLELAAYCPMQKMDVTNWLKRGENQIRVRADAVPGPPAIGLHLVVRCQDGQWIEIPSGNSWRVLGPDGDESPVASRGVVPDELIGLKRRSIELSPYENYEQWQQAKTDSTHQRPPRFWIVPGFEIAELRQAQPDEGSWISMAFDQRGRLTISREDDGLLRLSFNDQGSVARVEPIPAKLAECRGLVYSGDWLYANANNSKGTYRLQLTDDGTVRELKLLREFSGGVGHGRNDLALGSGTGAGPARADSTAVEGHHLYSIHGDSVDWPALPLTDRTSPLSETRRKPPQREGYLLRADLEGKAWELLCHGLRNPYGIALHRSGDPFTFDADNEYDMGTPWYRPTRVLQLLTGGDYGYREATGKLPPRFHDQPDHAPPLLDIGRSSPTAVMFGEALRFPEPYRSALFILDWTYGRVIVVHLAPRGATWRAAAELFLQGQPLNVTDLAAGPDGNLYLITGGRKTQSALYRMRFLGAPALPPASKEDDTVHVTSSHEQDARRDAASARAQLAELTATAPDATPTAPQELFARLADADPAREHAARIALERHPIAAWRPLVLESVPGPAALRGLLALARAREPGDVVPILERLGQFQPEQLDLSSQLVWVRIGDLCCETSPAATLEHASQLTPGLLRIWHASNPSVAPGFQLVRVSPHGTSAELRRRVAILLGKLGAAELPKLAVAGLLQSPIQEDQIAGLYALRDARQGWTIPLRRRQFETLHAMLRMLGGQGLPTFTNWLRGETIKTLGPDEPSQLAELLEPKADAVEPLPPPRAHVRKWSLAELVSLLDGESANGNPQRGQAIFNDALCVRCHRIGLRGAAVGPDLTFVARRFSRRDLLEAILNPSLSVAENYRLETVVTSSGQTFTGRIVAEGDYRSEKLQLLTDPLRPDSIVDVDKKEIVEHLPTTVSPMPQGLLDTFSIEEIRDLVAYLEGLEAGQPARGPTSRGGP